MSSTSRVWVKEHDTPPSRKKPKSTWQAPHEYAVWQL
jgi:hypothetical protein